MKRRFLFYLAAVVAISPLYVYAFAANHIPDKPRKIYVVKPNDTIWDIATKEYPGSLTDEMVYKIDKMNGITDSGQLQIGEELRLP